MCAVDVICQPTALSFHQALFQLSGIHELGDPKTD